VARILARDPQHGQALLDALEGPRTYALRVNTLKTSPVDILRWLPFHLSPVPWCSAGYYYAGDEKPGQHPLHWAGLYYIQDASAMYPVESLDVEPHHKVLDLSAAPGGKATQILAHLQGQGLLVANEVDAARAQTLVYNLESFGADNFAVVNSPPAVLARALPNYFDRILVDAPCSGEGLFRKDYAARQSWRSEHVASSAARQEEILTSALHMLRSGGKMVYSTCTFAEEENEWLLANMAAKESSLQLHQPTVRLLPHLVPGEGQFSAVLTKNTATPLTETKVRLFRPAAPPGKAVKLMQEFAGPSYSQDSARLHAQGDTLYRIPRGMPDLVGVRIVRLGLKLGTAHEKRFHPDHAFALSLTPPHLPRLDYKSDDPRLLSYLHGHVIPCALDVEGWVLICCEGFPLGLGKASQGQVKNHLPKGLRKL